MSHSTTRDAAFWNKIAPKYAKDPISDMASYDATIERVLNYLAKTDRVVELGCGTGTTALKLADAVEMYEATDISDEMVRIGREKAAKAGATTITFSTGTAEHDVLAPPESVDKVLSFNHLHLLPDPKATIRAAHAMLKPGGLFISKTICLNETWKMRIMRPMIGLMKLFGKAPGTVKFFDVAELDSMVKDAGFEIVEAGHYAFPRRFLVAKKI